MKYISFSDHFVTLEGILWFIQIIIRQKLPLSEPAM
jgi:hypothetical protein